MKTIVLAARCQNEAHLLEWMKNFVAEHADTNAIGTDEVTVYGATRTVEFDYQICEGDIFLGNLVSLSSLADGKTTLAYQELSDDEPPTDDSTGVYHYVYISTMPDGSANVEIETNDDDDDGYPDPKIEVWTEQYPSVEAAKKRHGVCRTGCSGVKVMVWLDGVPLM